MKTSRISCAAVGALLLISTSATRAGPPFLTDDPEPIEYRHSEAYAFLAIDVAADGKTMQFPAAEFNTSPYPDVHLHLVVPMTASSPNIGDRHYGLGDTEVGIKYRFVHETDTLPQIGIFPMVELPSGNADRGLGNGRTWWKLPLWLQKSWGSWKTYGGGGYAFNHAIGMRNYAFGGWLLQHDLSKRLTLGGEIFAQGPANEQGRSTVIGNFGGLYTPKGACRGCQVLFSAGHSVSGERHTLGYLALYWEFGAGSESAD
jgi:hypothetical protein